jgi:UDP-N-acetyl-2-amino-2-deoxyglucuronate dehydrogenase
LTLHVGLIGAGNISDTHARAAAAIPGVAIVGVYAPTREHAQRLAAAHGGIAHDTLDGLLNHQPLDLVVVGSPSGLHAEHGIAAARRGIHVLVEKPIDVTAARADALVAEAERAGVRLGVIFQDRLKPEVQRAQALAAGGTLGRPILATGRVKWYRPPEYYRGSRWRGTHALDGGGALMNQGVHTVDLLLWLFGPVRRVSARASTLLHDIEVEDTAVAVLEFESGALGTLEAATSAYPGYSRRIELTGSEGTLVIEGDRLAAVDLKKGAVPLFPEAASEKGVRPPSASSPVVADASAHQRVIEDFIRAIETGGTPCCDGREGRRSVALIEAIYRSSRTGQPVEPG